MEERLDMAKKYPPTALETKECPPHHFILDNENVGRCQKCPGVKDFSKLLRRAERLPIPLAKASKGGSKKKGGER